MLAMMIIFDISGNTLFKRLYEQGIDEKEIFSQIKDCKNGNFIYWKYQIVYKKYNDLYVCFLTRDENEFYMLELINFILKRLEYMLDTINEPVLSYYFKEVNNMLDCYIADGKITNLNMDSIIVNKND